MRLKCILYMCCLWVSCSAALEICNVSDKPVYFAAYYIDKGYAVRYGDYAQPLTLLPQQAQLLNPSSTLASLPFITALLPGRKCSAWGLAGKSDCRGYFDRTVLFSFNPEDISAAGHQFKSLTGDPSLNSGHGLHGGQKYFIFFNKHNFDPLAAVFSGHELMDKRNFNGGKLNLVQATTPLIVDALREYILFSNWIR